MRNIGRLTRGKNDKKGSDFLLKLFDVARCQDTDDCKCPPKISVPEYQKVFLADQRGEQVLKVQLTDKKLSLRSHEISCAAQSKSSEQTKRKFEQKTVSKVKKKGSIYQNEQVTDKEEDIEDNDECE